MHFIFSNSQSDEEQDYEMEVGVSEDELLNIDKDKDEGNIFDSAFFHVEYQRFVYVLRPVSLFDRQH